MSVPPPLADYDAITAPVREMLFRKADYLSAEDLQVLEKACAFAFRAHGSQKRQSGEPYITHPISVTAELAGWRMDLQTLCAGLMHDVLEDTPIGKAQIAEAFGDTVAEMVDGLSKLDKLEYDSQAEHQAESFRKLILAMTRDVRVIIVKLADRLHNMRTLGAKNAQSRRRIATETLEVYAPIANRLGLNHVYRELQDLSFQAMHPSRYRVLQRAMAEFKKSGHDVIERVLREFSLLLTGANIEAQIQGREKNLYNIHQKMVSKHLRFEEVLDIYGFRVIVNSVSACYTALGALHSLYKPRPGKIKDYIAIPKSNGYKSLHTTLTGPYGLPIEVQIRTREMHRIAESGVASHWAYKAGEGKEDEAALRTNQWLQSILDLQTRSDNAIEFLEHVKVDLFPNEVYIFTPKGKIFTLPRGATPIDFAYAVHTDIGNRCVGARVNKTPVPLRTVLKTGDTVEIITSDHGKPSPAWLSFAASSRARSAIRSYIKNTSREDAVALGERLLASALSSLLPRRIALGRTQPVSVAMEVAALAGRHLGGEVKLGTVKIFGNETSRAHLGKCCMPIPGDNVRAVIVKDQGMFVHRDTCPLLLKTDPEHQLDADWADIAVGHRLYDTVVTVSSVDTHALLAAITSAISDSGGNIASVDTLTSAQPGSEGFAEFRFRLNVRDLKHLQQITENLHQIPQVRKVVRE